MSPDGYLCSFAKSGRTWMRFALANLLSDVYRLDRQFDMDDMFALLPNDDGPERTHPWKAIDQYQFASVEEMPLIAMSHLDFDERFLSLPVVFLARNPADTLVSWYYHQRFHEGNIDCDINQFVVEEGAGDWISYTQSWLPHLKDENVLLLTYEQLKAEPLANFAALAAWLSIEASPDQLGDALAKSEIKKMRRVEQESGVGHNYDRSDPRASRVRKGKVGGFRDELSGETVDYLIAALQAAPALWHFLESNNLDPRSL